jgi:hypothetical protein
MGCAVWRSTDRRREDIVPASGKVYSNCCRQIQRGRIGASIPAESRDSRSRNKASARLPRDPAVDPRQHDAPPAAQESH